MRTAIESGNYGDRDDVQARDKSMGKPDGIHKAKSFVEASIQTAA